ncbi:hypothetical protein [Streptomyces cinereoruber]|uniref:hypothetical protein n=1 Tax=Streptomyces cinereoruber TaxID=67260 RepID=UPI003398665A
MTPRQVTDEQLKTMSPHDIVQAQEDGRLDQLLGRPVHDIPTEGQLERHHLQHMTPQQIVDAQEAGRLADILGQEA